LWSIFVLGSGTGHGVGAALNVHEGPQSISYRYGNLTALQKGMIVSNEPGYYEDNSFGIRIEVCFPMLLSPQSSTFCVLDCTVES
jgi:Xaa-Pro aminopeptidase